MDHGHEDTFGAAVFTSVADASSTMSETSPRLTLFLQVHRGTADAFAKKVTLHLNAVGDLNEGDATVHPVLLAVEGHDPLHLAYACPDTGNRQRQRLRFGDSAYREGTRYIKGVWTGLNNLGRFETDQRIVLGVEEVFALQLAVLHAASGIHARGLSPGGQ